jgi:cysteine-rich repeat protein
MASLCAAPIARANTVWSVEGGEAAISFDVGLLESHGISIVASDGQEFSTTNGRNPFEVDAGSSLRVNSKSRMVDSFGEGHLAILPGLTLEGPGGRLAVRSLLIGDAQGRSKADLAIMADTGDRTPLVLFAIPEPRIAFDQPARAYVIQAVGLTITAELAAVLGDDSLAGVPVGEMVVKATLAYESGEDPDAPVSIQPNAGEGEGLRGVPCSGTTGADVIVGVIPDISNATGQQLSGVNYETFAVGTTSCNVGDEELLWIASNNQHPVIGQNFYRLHNGRFEQLAQAWLKHGFTALQQNACSCGCVSSGTGSRLGIGCSDPYSSGLNFGQTDAGPKWQVNAWTGAYTYPPADPTWSGSVARRMHVRVDEIDPAIIGAGARYFVEAQYVTPDDAAAGNQDNNASYREMVVSGSGTAWTFAFAPVSSTQRGEAGVRAWKDVDNSVTETDIRVPSEGLFIVAAKATDNGNGTWHYEYAVENLNSDRSAKSFSIPVESGATVSNIGFRDVAYWDGDGVGSVNYDGTDWTSSHSGGAVTWNMVDLAGDNDNALRWGTTYNFRFDCNRAPSTANCTIGLYKSGSPTSISGSTVAPQAGPQDCNSNGIEDSTDIANGTSQDCNTNGVPDECESFTTPGLDAEQVVCGLTSPVYVTASPGDATRLFIVEQTGRIRIFNRTTSTLLATPYLNLSGIITSGGERGLLGLAFHPNYAANGFFYVNYTNTSGNTVVARYTRSTADTANAASAVILKTITQDFSNHNGGCLQFGPDGMLYIGMGDGGSAGDPNNRAQNTGSLLGKILRLDVDAASPYIPADNPFVGGGNPLDEIWAIGTRNPWRFSFDRLTGDMYMGDVGQDAREEINFQPASSTGGENWGWRCYEGNAVYNTTGCGPIGNYDFPILEVSHPTGCSITGGYVYRGCEIPGLSGTYFYSDYCSNWIRSFRYTPGTGVTDQQDLTSTFGGISGVVSFGEDSEGELYMVSLAGCVYKIVAQADPVCGNGTVESGEQCDDNNTNNGDGCSSTCQLESGDNNTCSSAAAVCPGSTNGSTASATVDGSASCGTSSSTPDVWYAYTPNANGTLNVNTCGSNDLGGADTGMDTVLSIHTACPGTTGNELTCNDDWNSGGLPANACTGIDSGLARDSAASVAVTAGTTYYIRVSGFSGSVGAFVLNVSGPACGVQITDCNSNGIDDAQDIASGTSLDCNNNDVPDECEAGSTLKTYLITPSPSVAIPDGNVAGVTTTFTVPDSGTIQDLNLGLNISHTWNGDLIVRLTHGATTVTVIDRPGVPASQFGSNDNGYNIVLDDEGTGAAIEGIELSGSSSTVISPPSYTPNNPLSAFDGMDKAGLWTLFVSDSVTPDSGSIVSWTLHISNQGEPVECPEDCNENGRDDADDIACGLGTICEGLYGSGDCNSNGIPDDCEIEDGSEHDCEGGPTGVIAAGQSLFQLNCQGCHNTMGQSGSGPTCGGNCPGPNIRNRTRAFLWNKLRSPTTHGGGAFNNFTHQNFADIEAWLADAGSRGRPDEIPDSCQSGQPDCDTDGTTDACELEAGTQIDANYNGIPDDCEGCEGDLECQDGNACTSDVCDNGTCVNAPISCADGNACTTDSCNPAQGCINTPIVCNDGDTCTTDSCSPALGCQFTPLDCDDDNECTDDFCSGGFCEHQANTNLCDDGDACTEGDFCANGNCVGDTVDCGDGNPCTTDSCDPIDGCENTPIEECCLTPSECDDGNACTTDTCVGNACQHTPISCNDSNPCTADSCDPIAGCENTPIVDCCLTPSECDDGSACTTDTCVGNACQHTPTSCNDSNPCTADSCDPIAGCENTPIVDCCQTASECDDGSACTTDTCVANACQNTPIVDCCLTPSECDDGSACTTDTCVANACQNTPISCNDSNPCTTDSCDPIAGCDFTPIVDCCQTASECDDDDACTIDTCEGNACVYTALSCDDGDACTTDSCSSASGCSNDAVDCNDNDPCTADSCDPQAGCQYAALPCDTGACCTDGVCTEGTPADCAGYVCDVAAIHGVGFIGCFADADGNNVVNAADRGAISANIGQTDNDLICLYDLDGNGVVNAADRGVVSANIGLCVALPDYQDGSGLNGGSPDTRFPGGGVFQGFGTTCAETTCP